MNRDYNQIAGQHVQRLEAISDGVFAIVLTLLVLDIHVPISEALHSEGELLALLYSLAPKLLSYFLSFMTLGLFWTGHSTQFNYINKVDWHLTWFTLFFLMFVSLLPFTTAFLSEYIDFKVSIGVYWLNIFAMGLTLLIHWNYADRHNFIAIEEAEREAISRTIKRRIVVAQMSFAVGALLCFLSTYISIAVIILIQLNYVLALLSWPTIQAGQRG